jgi:RNA polymerase sigma factor (sigma-70 family)
MQLSTKAKGNVMEIARARDPKPTLLTLDYSATHRDLVEKCKRGERQAQFELYRLFAKGMYNVCLRMLNNDQDAEDVLQNAFLDIFTKLDTFRYESSIGAWIKRIVVNNCINFLKRNRMAFEELSRQHQDVSATEEDHASTPEGLSVEAVRHALMDLPDGYRVVFSLYALEGYDHQEIGEILNITEATSKSQYSRARKKMKEILQSKISF